MDRRLITAVVVLIVAAIGTYMWLNSSSPKIDEGVTVGKRAVDIEVDGLNQTKFILSEHTGEVFVVEFMTLWCPACGAQIEAFKKLKGENDVTIASINVDMNLQPSADWATKMGVNWFIGNSLEAGLTYDISFVPTVIIIDKKGIIRYRGGPLSFDKLQSIIQQFQ